MRSWTKGWAVGTAVGLLLVAAPLAAQVVSVELGGGAAIGRYTETDAGLEILPGASLSATVDVQFLETVSGYVAIQRSSFGCEEGLCATRDVSMTSQGFALGARWIPNVPWDQGRLWARAGLALMALDVNARGGAESFDLGPGFDIGAGTEFLVGERIHIRPGVSYLWHAVSTDAGDEHAAVIAAHIAVAMPVLSF